VIYAWGPTAPTAGQDVQYHGTTNRGSQVLNLISSVDNAAATPTDSETVEFKVANVSKILQKKMFNKIFN
jgi:hypothetical protein